MAVVSIQLLHNNSIKIVFLSYLFDAEDTESILVIIQPQITGITRIFAFGGVKIRTGRDQIISTQPSG